jgi:hypothetical protein
MSIDSNFRPTAAAAEAAADASPSHFNLNTIVGMESHPRGGSPTRKVADQEGSEAGSGSIPAGEQLTALINPGLREAIRKVADQEGSEPAPRPIPVRDLLKALRKPGSREWLPLDEGADNLDQLMRDYGQKK